MADEVLEEESAGDQVDVSELTLSLAFVVKPVYCTGKSIQKLAFYKTCLVFWCSIMSLAWSIHGTYAPSPSLYTQPTPLLLTGLLSQPQGNHGHCLGHSTNCQNSISIKVLTSVSSICLLLIVIICFNWTLASSKEFLKMPVPWTDPNNSDWIYLGLG